MVWPPHSLRVATAPQARYHVIPPPHSLGGTYSSAGQVPCHPTTTLSGRYLLLRRPCTMSSHHHTLWAVPTAPQARYHVITPPHSMGGTYSSAGQVPCHHTTTLYGRYHKCISLLFIVSFIPPPPPRLMGYTIFAMCCIIATRELSSDDGAPHRNYATHTIYE